MRKIYFNADLVETGERIRERRVLLGISQETLAEAVGVTRNSISRYENGQTEMKLDVMYKICDFLKITPSDISPSTIIDLVVKSMTNQPCISRTCYISYNGSSDWTNAHLLGTPSP